MKIFNINHKLLDFIILHFGELDDDHDQPVDSIRGVCLDILVYFGFHRCLCGGKPHSGSGGHQILISLTARKR